MKTQVTQTLWFARPAKRFAVRQRGGFVCRCQTKATQPENRTGARQIAAARDEKHLLKAPASSAKDWADSFSARKTAKGKDKAADPSKGSFNP